MLFPRQSLPLGTVRSLGAAPGWVHACVSVRGTVLMEHGRACPLEEFPGDYTW